MHIELSGIGNKEWAEGMARDLDISLSQLLDAVLYDFRARITAESVLFEVDGLTLKQFRFNGEGLILGEEQFDFLVEEYMSFFDALKMRMIQEEAVITDGDGEL